MALPHSSTRICPAPSSPGWDNGLGWSEIHQTLLLPGTFPSRARASLWFDSKPKPGPNFYDEGGISLAQVSQEAVAAPPLEMFKARLVSGGWQGCARAMLAFRHLLAEISLWKPGCLVTNALPSTGNNGLL